MRILIVNDFGTPSGGAENMSIMLRDRLRARGHEARLFTSSARPYPLPIASDDQCFGSSTPLRHLLQLANPSAVRQLGALLRRFRPDVVHVRMFSMQLSPRILPLLRSVPSVLHVVNYNLICPRNTKVLPDGSACSHRAGTICSTVGCTGMRGVVRFALQRRTTDLDVFDAIITNSQWVGERLAREGVRVDGYIWNGVPVTEQRPPLGGPPLVGFAGRFFWKKGADVLLEAMAHVVARVPGARLRLLGDGPERARLKKLVEALHIGDAVEFAGFRPRAEAELMLRECWVQVVPSRWEEPFGLVAAEAMMRGTAAVVSDRGGPAEQVLEGVTGYRVPAGDGAALADALVRILSDRTHAEALGSAARRHAMANFGEERVVDQFETLYRRLTSGHRVDPDSGQATAAADASTTRQRA